MLDLDVSKLEPDLMDERWHIMLNDYVIDLALSPTGDQAVAITVEGAVILIDFNAESARFEQIGAHKNGGSAVAWDKTRSEFATAGQDGWVQVWDVASRNVIRRYDAGGSWVSCIQYSPKRGVLASAAGKCLKLWASSGTLIYESKDHKSTISDIDWKFDGASVAVAAANGVTLHTPGEAEPIRKFQWQGASLKLAWSPDGRFLATGEQDATVHFWFVDSGEDAKMNGFATKVQELSWHRSGAYLAIGGASSPTIWDCSGEGPVGRAPMVLDSHVDLVSQVAFQHAGDVLATGDKSGFLMLWTPKKHDKMIWGTKLPSEITKLTWSIDDQRVFVGQRNGLVTMFEWNASE